MLWISAQLWFKRLSKQFQIILLSINQLDRNELDVSSPVTSPEGEQTDKSTLSQIGLMGSSALLQL